MPAFGLLELILMDLMQSPGQATNGWETHFIIGQQF
jgi:hypothetical protein